MAAADVQHLQADEGKLFIACLFSQCRDLAFDFSQLRIQVLVLGALLVIRNLAIDDLRQSRFHFGQHSINLDNSITDVTGLGLSRFTCLGDRR